MSDTDKKNYNVDSYGWSNRESPDSCNYITPVILNILNRHKVTRIADLGCGNGVLCSILKEKGYQVAGFEYDKEGVSIARMRNKDIKFYNIGIHEDPDEILKSEDKFDVVVSTEVIEHLYAPHQLPQFANKILADKGLLIISTPYHGYLKNLAISIFGGWDKHFTALWCGGHIKFWSFYTLKKIVEDNGFTYVEFNGSGRVPFFWKSMIIVFRKI